MRQYFSMRHASGVSYHRSEAEQLVEKLTNWQRRRWQLAGRPMDIPSLRRFGRLQRDGSEIWQGDILPPQP